MTSKRTVCGHAIHSRDHVVPRRSTQRLSDEVKDRKQRELSAEGATNVTPIDDKKGLHGHKVSHHKSNNEEGRVHVTQFSVVSAKVKHMSPATMCRHCE